MTLNPIPPRQRPPGARGHIAGMIALVALFVAVAAWFWTTRQPPQQADAGIGLPHGVIVVSAGAFVAALIAQIRAMSFWDVLEAAWELLLGFVALIGAILKGIWNGILGLFGWN